MARNGNRLVVTLIVVLLIVVGASLSVIFLVPAFNDSDQLPEQGSETVADFNLDLFERQEFLQIDSQLIHQGLLPVEAPPEQGKANPFQ